MAESETHFTTKLQIDSVDIITYDSSSMVS